MRVLSQAHVFASWPALPHSSRLGLKLVDKNPHRIAFKMLEARLAKSLLVGNSIRPSRLLWDSTLLLPKKASHDFEKMLFLLEHWHMAAIFKHDHLCLRFYAVLEQLIRLGIVDTPPAHQQ
jgi:hypothetical protein